MIEIYGHPATRSFRVYWALEELGLEYKMHPVKPGTETHNKEFYKLNPNGKVPVLKEGDFYLFESAAICYYICTKSPGQSLLPNEGSRDRALIDQWIFWTQSELEQVPWLLAKHTHVYPKKYRLESIKKGALYEWEAYIKILHNALKNREYILGGTFSLADIFLAHTLNWASKMDLVSKNDSLLKDYIQRNKERSSFIKAKALLKKLDR